MKHHQLHALLALAKIGTRTQIYRAAELVHLDGKTPNAAAVVLGIRPNAVHGALNRIAEAQRLAKEATRA